MKEELYLNIVGAIVDKGYVVVDDVLDKVVLDSLLTEAINKESSFQRAGISASNMLHLDSSKRRDKIFWLDEDGAAMSEYLKFTERLREILNRELYLGLSYYEAHFARYEEGDFYEKHLDAFKHSKNRIVTTVLYLNKVWQEDDGGELIIYDMDGNAIQKVVPNGGRLVVFLSDKFPHEVLPAKAKRHSIAGWYRVDR